MCIMIYCNNSNIKEGVRSGGTGRHNRVGRRGGRHNRVGRRRWYGSNIGYSYRPPLVRYYPRYAPLWSSAYWFGSICKDGCTNIGNNNWGCQFPGNGPDDCVFASDCYGCGY